MADKASKDVKAEVATQSQNQEENKEKKEPSIPSPPTQTLPRGVLSTT